MLATASTVFYNHDQETEVRVEEKKKRKEVRHAQMLADLQGKATSKGTLEEKDKSESKCHICQQQGHWAQGCHNKHTLLSTGYYKYGQHGDWATLCPLTWGATGARTTSNLPDACLRMRRSPPVSPTFKDPHHWTGAKGANGCGR